LVDTSVLIGFFKGDRNPKVELLEKVIERQLPFGIASYTYQEVLQGARDEAEYDKLKEYLSTQKIYFLQETVETYEKTARLFFDLRRKGITPRSTIDIFITIIALEQSLFLLHNDKDFDVISNKLPDIKILKKVD
jgi:predicted nucleic acid-binding protein